MKFNIRDVLKDKKGEFPLKKYFNKDTLLPKKDFLSKKEWIFFGLILVLVLLGDQLTKTIISNTIEENGSIAIIDNFFYFTYVLNKGVAWSWFEWYSSYSWLFSFVTIFAVGAVYMFFLKTRGHEQLTRFGLVLIVSGAVGNFIDRLIYGHVRDFMDFQFGSYVFPTFNVADMAIIIGIGLIILEMLMEEYEIWKISKSL